MRFLAGLILALTFTAAFRVPIKKYPVVFYVLATLLVCLLLISNYLLLPPWFREYFLFLFQSNTLAMGLFTVVMFLGVFSEKSKIRKMYTPIRAELSIIATILSIGHIIKYGEYYLRQLLLEQSSLIPAQLFAIGIAVLLVLLLVPLAVTSIKFIHARIKQKRWQHIQFLAYPFYVLIFIHILFFLVPPALSGSFSAMVSVVVYVALAAAYIVLRFRAYYLSQNLNRKETITIEAMSVDY